MSVINGLPNNEIHSTPFIQQTEFPDFIFGFLKLYNLVLRAIEKINDTKIYQRNVALTVNGCKLLKPVCFKIKKSRKIII